MSRPNAVQAQFTLSLPMFVSGKIFFVDSTYGSNSYSGLEPHWPFRSITYALANCVSDRGDVIVVHSGYNLTSIDTETNGDDTPITIAVDGVTILFSGKNNHVTAIASADSIFKITADEVTIGVLPGGKIFVDPAEAGTASTVVELATGSEDCEIFGFDTTTTLDNYDEVITISATSHGAYIHDNRFIGDTTDTDEGIMIEGTVDSVRICDNELILCCTANGAIYSASVHTNCIIKGNIIDSRTASKLGINFTANATGMIVSNRIYVATDALGCVNGQCAEYDNLINDAFTTMGFPSPAVGTVT